MLRKLLIGIVIATALFAWGFGDIRFWIVFALGAALTPIPRQA